MCANNSGVLFVVKIEFMNEKTAAKACATLNEYGHALLGSAVVIAVNGYNSTHVANVCADFGGFFADDVTDYDIAQVM